MTTKAQLKKAAMGLPEVVEDMVSGLPAFRVRATTFAALTEEAQVELQLPGSTLADALERYPAASHAGDGVLLLPLSAVNGMELNGLVYRAWLHRAPAELADAAQAARIGKAAAGEEHGLPRSIGRPATSALLLAGIKTLTDTSKFTREELLALHGVGPRAIRLLGDALAGQDLEFREPAGGADPK